MRLQITLPCHSNQFTLLMVMIACFSTGCGGQIPVADSTSANHYSVSSELDNWTGKKVMPKLGAVYKHGKNEDYKGFVPLPIDVREDKQGRLYFDNLGGDDVWLKKEQTVPLEDAIVYYSEIIETESMESRAYLFRGNCLVREGRTRQSHR